MFNELGLWPNGGTFYWEPEGPKFDLAKLVVMEGSLVGYEKLPLNEAKRKVDDLKSEVQKYNGEFVFLYHNSSFFEGRYRSLGIQLLNHLYK